MVYKTKADERLFNLFTSVSHGVRNLGAVVQNDHELTSEQFLAWMNHASNTQVLIQNLIRETIEHLTKDAGK